MRHRQTAALRYPQLWRGCIGAWSPGVGSISGQLADSSTFNGNIPLIDTTVVAGNGASALSFATGTSTAKLTPFTVPASVFSVSLWMELPDPATSPWSMSDGSATNNIMMYGDAAVLYVFGTSPSSANRWSITSPASLFASGRLTHVVVICVSGAAPVVYISGNLITPTASSTMTFPSGMTEFNLGNRFGTSYHYTKRLGGGMLFGRTLLPQEARLLSMRPNIEYETRRAHRGYVAATGNRRRRLLIGAG